MQTFFVYIIHFVESIYKNSALHEEYRHNPLEQWSDKEEGRLYCMYVEVRLALDCSAWSRTVKRLNIWHADTASVFLSLERLETEKCWGSNTACWYTQT